MARIKWDLESERFYENGVDRAVIYPENGPAVPWNGLTYASEKRGDELHTPLYYEGTKYDVQSVRPDRSTTVKALTYPDILESLTGYEIDPLGIMFDEQPFEYFSMTYRTLINNGEDYKIHLLLNQKASQSDTAYATVNNTVNGVEFSWDLVGFPYDFKHVTNPTSHFVFDSRKVDKGLLTVFEESLYGSETTEPSVNRTIDLIELLYKHSDEWVLLRSNSDEWVIFGPDDNVEQADGYFVIENNNITFTDHYYTIDQLGSIEEL